MMKNFIIMFIVLLCTTPYTMAQGVEDNKKEPQTKKKEELQEESKKVYIPKKELQEMKDEIKIKSKRIKELNDSISIYNEWLDKDSIRIGQLNARCDSLLIVVKSYKNSEQKFEERKKHVSEDSLRLVSLFNQKLTDLEEKEKLIRHKSERADTISIQLMITYMNLKGCKEKVAGLRKSFAGISDESLKNEYKTWDDILAIYTETYNKIVGLAAEELKTKKIAKASSSLYRDIDIKKYKTCLDNLEYVKSFYKNEEYTSAYLNEMLDLSYKVLNEKDFSLLEKIVEM